MTNTEKLLKAQSLLELAISLDTTKDMATDLHLEILKKVLLHHQREVLITMQKLLLGVDNALTTELKNLP